MQNANFPTDSDGRVYHLFIKPGEAANRVLTVGDVPRAVAIAKTPGFEVKFIRKAPRLFTTITGLYKGKPVTIITSLMGIPNADFTFRELRHCIQGPFAIIRIGTCGTPLENAKVGDLVIPDLYHTVLRNPDAFTPGENHSMSDRYHVSKGMKPDAKLTEIARKHVKALPYTLHAGACLSCCSFYSAQGRQDPNFNDQNGELVDHYVKTVPNFSMMEMESSHFCDLSRCVNANVCGAVYMSAAHIVLAQRKSNDFLSNEKKHEIESGLGKAILDTLIEFEIPNEVTTVKDSVWTHKGEPLGDWAEFKAEFK